MVIEREAYGIAEEVRVILALAAQVIDLVLACTVRGTR